MKTKLLLAIGICLLVLACDKETHSVYHPEGPFKKTIMLYMVAESNLSGDGYQNIRKIMNGCNSTNLKDNTILLYFDPADSDPRLLQIVLNQHNEVQLDTVRWFEEQNLASGKVLADAIDMMLAYESDKYDLILWGHATGWLPADYEDKFTPLTSASVLQKESSSPGTYAYGGDKGRYMEIEDLVAALPDGLFDMIMFDACYMAGAEVAYALRNKATNLIASSAEIIGEGFPYDKVMDYLLSNHTNYEGLCQGFYEYYQSQSGARQSATISWIDLKNMANLAAVTKEILLANQQSAAEISLSGIQNFDRVQTGRQVIRDMGQYIETISSSDEYNRFLAVLNQTVLFKRNTDWFFRGQIAGYPITHHSGLTIYPYYSYNYLLNLDYQELDWYKAVYQ